MGFFDWLFGGKKSGERPKQERTRLEDRVFHAPINKGIATIVEVCSRNDILGDSLINRGIQELKQEGSAGTHALAELVRELLSCRSPKIRIALSVATKLEPTSDLIKAVQEVMEAQALAPQPTQCRFTPEIVGGGRVGWTDGTAQDIREMAKEALVILGVALPHASQTKETISATDRDWSDIQHKLANIVKDFAARKADGIDVDQLIAKMRPEETAAVLRYLLESDLNGGLGLAAVQSLTQIKPEHGLQLIAKSINSTNDSVRNVSISYLARYPTAEAKALAVERLKSEQRDDFRSKLQRVIDTV